MNKRGGVAVLGGLALWGCDASPGDTATLGAEEAPATALVVRDGVVVARAIRTPWPDATPRGPVPTTAMAAVSWAAADHAAFVAERCAGDPGAEDELLHAIRAAAAVDDPADVVAAYTPLAIGCADAETCGRLRALARGGEPGVADVAARALVACRDPETRRLVESDAVSLEVAVLWAMSEWPLRVPSPRLEAAFDAALAAEHPAAPGIARAIASGPGGERVVLEAIGTRASPAMRDALIPVLIGSQDPGARALVDGWCASRPEPVEVCAGREHAGTLEAVPDPATDLDAWVRHWAVDPWLWAELEPAARPRLAIALDRCVATQLGAYDVATWTVGQCLAPLAALDPARAAELAASVPDGAWGDPALDTLVDALARPPEGGIEAALRRHGLLGDGEPPPGLRPPVTAAEWMAATGRGLSVASFGAEWPVDYAALAASLAPLAGGALDGVAFTSRAPTVRPDGTASRYALFAVADRRRWRVALRDVDDGLDLRPVIGLLNAVLEARGAEVRCAAIADTDTVVCGPAAGLRAATDAGLLRTDRPEDALNPDHGD